MLFHEKEVKKGKMIPQKGAFGWCFFKDLPSESPRAACQYQRDGSLQGSGFLVA